MSVLVCACVNVCVCVRERESVCTSIRLFACDGYSQAQAAIKAAEAKRAKDIPARVYGAAEKGIMCVCVCVCVCVRVFVCCN
jgi:hypothetical protein